MKTLIKKIAVAGITMLSAVAIQAGVTNITVKFTVEIAGVGTNNSSLKFQQDGSNKDAKIVDGTVWQWKQYQATAPSGTVATNSLEVWLKDGTKERLTGYATTKSVVDNAARKQKLDDLLTSQSDALSAGDLSSIDSIIAKWTAP